MTQNQNNNQGNDTATRIPKAPGFVIYPMRSLKQDLSTSASLHMDLFFNLHDPSPLERIYL